MFVKFVVRVIEAFPDILNHLFILFSMSEIDGMPAFDFLDFFLLVVAFDLFIKFC